MVISKDELDELTKEDIEEKMSDLEGVRLRRDKAYQILSELRGHDKEVNDLSDQKSKEKEREKLIDQKLKEISKVRSSLDNEMSEIKKIDDEIN